ncbi:dihydrofolate reductase family protein [Aeromicrobium terrae]|uniref:Riboflavin biosynthesis protein RibD n=1 Tax=Aeromicrobium terrae TaxID=2498846 RepID=A0A5C8NGC7_9ACTN|nr:dihydrofolate reductase family protein [Aeromicrobium terrae]TXL60869.1 riboflavin biosynthesis protein RibD [Aeromicrobium terrae]
MATVLYMSMSLDGYVAGPNETDDNGLGDGGDALHDWVLAEQPGPVNQQVIDEFMATGAIVAGRGTFEPAEGWGGDHHDGVPMHILSRRPRPDWTANWPLVHYGNDVEEAFAAAREAAGDQDVLVHGAAVTQRAIAAGVLDELQIHLVPILLGGGRPLFEGVDQRHLELVRVLEGEGVTHLRYRVRR